MLKTARENHVKQSGKQRSKLRSSRYLAYLIHSFIGLKLTLLLIVVLLTGAIATVQQELDWLIYPEMRASQETERLNPGELLDNLQAAYPGNGLFFFRTAEDYPHLNAYARFIDDNGGWRHAWVDPYTGEVAGDTALLSLGQFLGFMHATLFLPAIGNSIVNGLGLLVLLSLITGLIAIPKFWRYFLRKPRTGNTRVFLADLHRLIGLWSLWIVLIIGVTGAWWFYEDPFVKYAGAPALVEPYPQKPLLSYEELEQLAQQGTPARLPAADVVEQVQKNYPDLNIKVINPPEHNADVYEVIGQQGEWLLSEWTGHRIMVNPYSGEIVATYPASELTSLQRTDIAMRPLHYGTWASGSFTGDLSVKGLYFIGGLAMTFLAVSGLIISYKRTRKAGKRLIRITRWKLRARQGWHIIRPWGGPMGILKCPNALAVVMIMIGTGIALTLSSQGTKGSGFLYQEQQLGAWPVSMNAVAGLLEKDLSPIRPGSPTNINVALPQTALDEIKFIYVRVGKPRTMRAPGTLVHGPIGAKHAHLKVPARAGEQSSLWLTAETWQGDYYQVEWPLFPDGKLTVDARG